jgi:hypothetical protein
MELDRILAPCIFTLFPRLPLEIQDMIWIQILLITRVVEICLDRSLNLFYQCTLSLTQRELWGEPMYGPRWQKIDVFTSIRYVCQRSRYNAGPVITMKSLFYSSSPPVLSHMKRYIINSDIDITNFGDYRARLFQHFVRGRPLVTLR